MKTFKQFVADDTSSLEDLTKQVHDKYVARYGNGKSLFGHCNAAARDLEKVLARARIAGAYVEGSFDAPFMSSSTTHHAWVEVNGLILDPTIDQFGSSTHVSPVSDARYVAKFKDTFK